MWDRVFLEHPRAVGETYLEHLAMAAGFGWSLVVAGLACMLHALIPVIFTTTASREVDRLHGVLVVARRRRAAGGHETAQPASEALHYVI